MSSVAHPAPRVFDSGYLHALRQKDPDVETHFVEHFSPILLRNLRRKLRCADQVKDLRQETFLRVLTAVRSGRGIQKPESLNGFVTGVCNNIVRETLREQRRSVAFSELEIEPAAKLPSAYTLVLAQQTRARLRDVLSQLYVRDRRALEAMLIDAESADEICARLGVSRGYFRVLVHRAKKKFALRSLPKRRLRREGDA